MVKRFLILGTALIAMAALIGVAFVADSVRLTRAARASVDVIDVELKKQEDRYVRILSEEKALPAEVTNLIEAHAKAPARADRQQAFADLVVAANDMLAVETDLSAGLKDRLAGALNRWSVLDRQFQAELESDRSWQATLRGRIGAQAIAWLEEKR